jgi:hypothetical protein
LLLQFTISICVLLSVCKFFKIQHLNFFKISPGNVSRDTVWETLTYIHFSIAQKKEALYDQFQAPIWTRERLIVWIVPKIIAHLAVIAHLFLRVFISHAFQSIAKRVRAFVQFSFVRKYVSWLFSNCRWKFKPTKPIFRECFRKINVPFFSLWSSNVLTF